MSVARIEDSRPQGAGRIPPHNLQAEESLLGAMLLSRDAIAVAVERVSADDFYRPARARDCVHLLVATLVRLRQQLDAAWRT